MDAKFLTKMWGKHILIATKFKDSTCTKLKFSKLGKLMKIMHFLILVGMMDNTPGLKFKKGIHINLKAYM